MAVQYEGKSNGFEKLKLTARNRPDGDYDAGVGAVVQGTLHAIVSGGETAGEIEFEDDPDYATELLLNLPVLGQSISVSQGGVLLFERGMPGA